MEQRFGWYRLQRKVGSVETMTPEAWRAFFYWTLFPHSGFLFGPVCYVIVGFGPAGVDGAAVRVRSQGNGLCCRPEPGDRIPVGREPSLAAAGARGRSGPPAGCL